MLREPSDSPSADLGSVFSNASDGAQNPPVIKNSALAQDVFQAARVFEGEAQQLVEKKLSFDKTKMSAADIARNMTDSVSFLSKYMSIVTAANNLGTGNEVRTFDDLSNHVLPLVVKVINENKAFQPPKAKQLLRLYAASHDNKLVMPFWFGLIQSTVGIEINAAKLPIAEDYAGTVPEGGNGVKKLVAECLQARSKYEELRQQKDADGTGKVGPGGDETQAALTEYDRKQETLTQELIRLRVDPAQAPASARQSSFHLSLNPETVDQLASYFNELGNLIVALSGEEKTPLTSPLSVLTPKIQTQPRQQFTGFEWQSLPSLTDIPRRDFSEHLPQIVEAYASLRQIIMQTYKMQLESVPKDPAQGQLYESNKRKLAHALSTVFPGDPATVINSLKKIDNPALQKTLRHLLFSHVVTGAKNGEMSLFIAAKQNNLFLPDAMRAILEGDQQAITQFKSGPTEFQRFVEMGLRMRHTIRHGQREDLAELLDDELKRCTSKTASPHGLFEQQMAVLIGIAALTEDPSIANLLKAQLRNKGMIAELAEQISRDISGKGGARGEFVENLRISIERRFSPTLRDYWGKDKLKESFKRAVADHLTLLRNSKSWEGLDPKTVFENGHLLIGRPGVGKGYLVACLANEEEFNLPVETVTREQLENSLLKGKDSPKGKEQERLVEIELESAFASFIDTRIEAARTKMKKFGSIASIIFIDEMEAEFLNRDPSTGDRAELTRTNVMLRVIEKKISENPDIIFIGATNYIAHVDPAAYRVGRFGIPWVIDYPDQEDVKEILAGNFQQLRVNCDEAQKTETYKKLVDSCVGLTPLTIGQLVNNYVCVLRAREDKPVRVLDDAILSGISERVEILKSRFKARDELLSPKKSAASSAPKPAH